MLIEKHQVSLSFLLKIKVVASLAFPRLTRGNGGLTVLGWCRHFAMKLVYILFKIDNCFYHYWQIRGPERIGLSRS